MKIILKIDGGIGKSIMATAVCKAIKTQYLDSKLIVITGYPEVFEGNRKVFKVYRHNELNYFYKDHLEGQSDTKFFLQEPYIETEFIPQLSVVFLKNKKKLGVCLQTTPPRVPISDW